jgi:hypothetical protein
MRFIKNDECCSAMDFRDCPKNPRKANDKQ